MTAIPSAERRPQLVSHARYRWDERRKQHQLLFPEGMLVLNDTAAAITQLCDGRSIASLIQALNAKYPGGVSAAEVDHFLHRLESKGLLRDADDA